MNLYDVLKLKFPNNSIGPGCDICLSEVSPSGIIISQWNQTTIGQEPPTQDQINAWLVDPTLQQQYTFAQNKLTNQLIYDQLDVIDAKSIRALRTNDTQRLSDLENQAIALRAQLLPVS